MLSADPFRSALDIGKSIVALFLVGANQQVRELAARGPCLGKEFRDRELEQRLGKQEARLQRHAANGRFRSRIDRLFVERFVEEPTRLFLKNLRNDLQKAFRRSTFAVLDHG